MDPITTAIVAGAAGAASDLTKNTIKNSYDALKSALRRRFGSDSDLVEAVDGLEKNSDSEGCKSTVQEKVKNAKVNGDAEIIGLAQDLLYKIKNQLNEEEQRIGGSSPTQTNTGNVTLTAGRDASFKQIQKIYQGLTSKDIQQILDKFADKSQIWERIWDLKSATEVETNPNATPPAMYPVIVNENLDAVRHTLEIPDQSRIRFKIELNIEGYLLLFEKGTSGTIWCWCPSRFAPQTFLSKKGMTIPQINNQGEYVPKKGIWLEARSLQLMGKGTEYMLAILIDEPPTFTWIEKAKKPKNPAYKMNKDELNELSKYLESHPESQIYKMDYQVT